MALRLPCTVVLLGACATYVPQPLDPPSPAAWNERRLDDPRVAAALDSLGRPGAPETWDDWQLAQAAWLMRPERARAAAEVAAADAARVAAGARTAPGIATETEYSFGGAGDEWRWGGAFAGIFTMELGGKRAARLAHANARKLAVLARGEGEGWEVRWRVREAAWRRNAAGRLLVIAESERGVLDSLLLYSRQRYADGTLGRLEIARVESERQQLEADIALRRRELDEAESALAAAVGVPTAELRRARPPAGSGARCPPQESRPSLQQLALDRRWALRQVLAEYQVAEAELRVEVARSWPNLEIGPGLFFDHGTEKWTVLLGLPALSRNRGGIAEAEAGRRVAAQRVVEVQERVLGEVERGLAICQAAEHARAAIDSAPGAARLAYADSAWARGEIGRLDVVLVRLDVVRSARRAAEAAMRVEFAALELERAVGAWSRAAGGAQPEGKE
jgi:outer membrane protein TolC